LSGRLQNARIKKVGTHLDVGRMWPHWKVASGWVECRSLPQV